VVTETLPVFVGRIHERQSMRDPRPPLHFRRDANGRYGGPASIVAWSSPASTNIRGVRT